MTTAGGAPWSSELWRVSNRRCGRGICVGRRQRREGECQVKDEIGSMLELMLGRVQEALGEIPDERLHWRPTCVSTTPAEIVWHTACVERRLGAILRGDDPNLPGATAGTRDWIEAAARGEADTSAVPRDRAGLEAAL